MNIKDKMFKILKDTRDWYAEDPKGRRSLDKDGNCLFTWGKNHCAVGRYMQETFQQEDWVQNNESVNELCNDSPGIGYNIDWCLREEVQGLDTGFWVNLQDMHDTMSYWNEKGLTDRGKESYIKLIDRIIEGDFNG